MSYDDCSEAPMISYGGGESGELDGATFVRMCPTCNRFVKADDEILISEARGPKEPNATCSKHGRVAMPFIGYL